MIHQKAWELNINYKMKQKSAKNIIRLIKNIRWFDSQTFLLKKEKPINEKQNFILTFCLTCKQKTRIEFHIGCYWPKCEYIINEQKHRTDKTVFRQDRYFPTELPSASKKIRKYFIQCLIINITKQKIWLKNYKR